MTFTRVLQGDVDEDGDVDLADYIAMLDCLAGPDAPLTAGCEVFDLDGDNDTDLADLLAFQAAFTGAR